MSSLDCSRFRKCRNHESAEIKLNDDELKNKLTTDRPTNFVIHGFMSGLDAGIVIHFTFAFARKITKNSIENKF